MRLERSVAENTEQISEERGQSTRTGGRRRKRPRRGSAGQGICQRGASTRVWASLGAIEDSQGLPKACATILAKLSSLGSLETALEPQPHSIIVDMKNMLSGDSWKESQTAFQVNSLENIILRCQRVEKVEVGVQFISMVNFIQLAAKVERYVYSFKAFNCFTQSPCSSIRKLKKLGTATEVLQEELSNGGQSFHKRTVQKWLANGTKLAVLAGAGESLFQSRLKRCLISYFFFQDLFTC
jgi:hypothetical protein